MSGKHLGLVIQHSRQRGAGFTLMMILADSMNAETSEAWLSIDRQAKDARVDRSTVIRLHRQLVESHELKIEPGAGPSGTNVYRMGEFYRLLVRGEEGGRTTPPPFDEVADVAVGVAPGDPPGGGATPPEHLSGSHPDSSMRPERIGTLIPPLSEEMESSVPNRSGRNETPPLRPGAPGDAATGDPPSGSRDQTLYVQALAILQHRVPKADFFTWLTEAEVAWVSREDGRVLMVLQVQNRYALSKVGTYLPQISKAVTEVSGCPAQVTVREA